MQQIEDGLNQKVTVEIEYTDGRIERVVMSKREAIELQNLVAGGRKPGVRRVSW